MPTGLTANDHAHLQAADLRASGRDLEDPIWPISSPAAERENDSHEVVGLQAMLEVSHTEPVHEDAHVRSQLALLVDNAET